MSAALLAYLAARKRNKANKRRRDIDALVEALKDDEDRAEDALAALKLRQETDTRDAERKETRRRMLANETARQRWTRRTLTFFGQTWLQLLQYCVMIIFFQSLTSTIRTDSEFYLDKELSVRFMGKAFDHRHHMFNDVRTIAEVHEWLRKVLVPAIYHNADEGQAWPDGDGTHSLDNPTPLSVSDLVAEANTLSMAEGIVFKQVRMSPQAGKLCYANHSCYREPAGVGDPGDTASYGAGLLTGSARDVYSWWDAESLGANPSGINSASHVSGRVFSSSGFVAVFRPFFSETYLPDEEGTHQNVTDFRLTEALPHNERAPNYQCARYSTNGHWVVQRCNPDPLAAGGVPRAMLLEMLTALKKARWVDKRTSMFSITLQVRNNNEGIRFLNRFMFEFTQVGTLLTSFDTETLLEDPVALADRKTYLTFCLVITLWFVVLEALELWQFGVRSYFSNVWNVLDWLNFVVFSQAWGAMTYLFQLHERDDAGLGCASALCLDFGHYDAWEVFAVARNAKFTLSICVCIQFLKVIKFTNVLVPKMSLMTRVLSKGASNLMLFGGVFMISMFAFSMLFNVQLGAAMDDFYSVDYSMISLTRGLFGDFNFVEIIENSRGYLNATFFLIYLFVAVFILLALFLSILGESQAAARDDELALKAKGMLPEPYGILAEMGEFVSTAGNAILYELNRRLGRLKPAPSAEEQALLEQEIARREAESPHAKSRAILAKKLRKFRPNFEAMVDGYIGAFEQTFEQRVAGIEASVYARAAVKATRSDRRSSSSGSSPEARRGLGGGSSSLSTECVRAGTIACHGSRQAKGIAKATSWDMKRPASSSFSKGHAHKGGSQTIRPAPARPGAHSSKERPPPRPPKPERSPSSKSPFASRRADSSGRGNDGGVTRSPTRSREGSRRPEPSPEPRAHDRKAGEGAKAAGKPRQKRRGGNGGKRSGSREGGSRPQSPDITRARAPRPPRPKSTSPRHLAGAEGERPRSRNNHEASRPRSVSPSLGDGRTHSSGGSGRSKRSPPKPIDDPLAA